MDSAYLPPIMKTIYIYIHVRRRKDKSEERYMFDGVFTFQRVLTSRFFLNTKIFYQNYFLREIIMIDECFLATSTNPGDMKTSN